MAVDIIVLAILAVLAALSIRKIVMDKKNGVPSCGYACGGACTSCSGGCDPKEHNLTEKELMEIRDRIQARSRAQE